MFVVRNESVLTTSVLKPSLGAVLDNHMVNMTKITFISKIPPGNHGPLPAGNWPGLRTSPALYGGTKHEFA